MKITPDLLLQAYRAGIFPMADDADATELFWYDPPERTIFPLDAFHVPARLRRTIRQRPYRLTINQAFTDVMRLCAAPNPSRGREKTWINAEIIALYSALHRQGYAHSIEAWQDNQLVGGLYGIQIGGAFFGESMVSRARDASKICLITLVALLKHTGAHLLDCQFMTPHLRQFGAITISRADYHGRLALACQAQGVISVGVWSGAAGAGGAAIGGTYPGTAVGKDIVGSVCGTGAVTAIGAGTAATGAAGATGWVTAAAGAAADASGVAPSAGSALDAVVMGFLQAITQTS